MATNQCPQYPGIGVDTGDALSLKNIRLEELNESRHHESTTKGETWILRFMAHGSDLEFLVKRRIDHPTIGIPNYFQGIPLREYSGPRRVGFLTWEIEAIYGYRGVGIPAANAAKTISSGSTVEALRRDPPSTAIAMSTAGGSHHIKKALYEIDKDGNAPNTRLAIEAFDGKVNGIEVATSNTVWREVWKMTIAEVFQRPPTDSGGNLVPGYLDWLNSVLKPDIVTYDVYGLNKLSLAERWDKMSGWVHGYDWSSGYHGSGTPFRHFHEGSLRFDGATISQINDFELEATLEFTHQANSWEDIPPQITLDEGIQIRPGWSDTWYDTNPGSEANTPAIRQNPIGSASELQIYKNGWDHFQVFYSKFDEDPGDGEGEIVLDIPRHYVMQQIITFCPFAYLGVGTYPVVRQNAVDGRVPPLGLQAERSGYQWEANLSVPATPR